MDFSELLGFILGYGMIFLTGKPLLRAIEQSTNEVAPNELMDVGRFMELFNRGAISHERFSAELSKMGFNEERIGYFELLTQDLLPLGDVVSAFYRGTIDETEFYKRTGALGYPDEVAKIIKGNFTERIGVGDVFDAERRGFPLGNDPASLPQELAARGWTQERVELLRKLAYKVPAVPDLVTFATWGVDDPQYVEKLGLMQNMPATFLAEARAAGWTDEQAKRFWASHWTPPPIFILHTLFQTGQITEDDLSFFLKVAQHPPEFIPNVVKAFYKYPSESMIIDMLKNGIIDESSIDDMIDNTGYTPEAKANLHKLIVLKAHQPSQAEKTALQEKKDAVKGLTVSTVLSSFEEKLIDENAARNYLAELGEHTDVIDLHIKHSQYKMERADLNNEIAYIGDNFKAGTINETTARSFLVQIGVSSFKIEHLITSWIKGGAVKTKHPSEAQLASFLKNGIITLDEFTSEMEALGWNDKYIAWFVGDLSAKASSSAAASTTAP